MIRAWHIPGYLGNARLKLNYTKALNAEPGGAQSDSVLGGVGFFF